MTIIKFFALVIVSYLMGNISVARMITKKDKNDITKQGSGNPGTMNMLRNYGAKMGFLTLFCDAIKAAIPALISYLVLFPNDQYLSIIALFASGLSAVLGHMFPVFYGFKGGKGIACTIGVFAVANPLLALVVLLVDFVFFYFVKIGSLASMFFIIIFAIVDTFITDIKFNFVAMIIMWLIVVIDVIAHRNNFIKLFANEERLTSFKEGVEKDLQKAHDKKAEKLGELDNKEQAVIDKYQEKLQEKEKKAFEKYQEKLAKKEEAIKEREEKSLKRVAKKKERLQASYQWRVQQIEKESDRVVKDMQIKIERNKAKMQKKAEKEQSKDENNDPNNDMQ